MATVRIVFKSGHVEEIPFEEFSVIRDGVGHTSYRWRCAGGYQLLRLDADSISAIIELPRGAVSP